MNIGARLSDKSPWAMVMPPGSSFFARSWSTWIHCSSQVACAKRLMRSWVTSIHSLAPTSLPTAALNSLKSLKMRMSDPRTGRCGSDLHFRNLGWNEQIRFRHGHYLGHGDARRGLLQCYPSAGKADDRHIGDHQVDRPGRGQRQRAFLDNFRFPFGVVL